MNAVIQYAGQAATMSSREIAMLTGKQHQHVKRDIENMLIDLNEDVSTFGHIYLDAMNRKQTEYHLDRDMTDCLLTGYSAKARMAVIKRWRDLESGAHQIPKTFAESLRLNADLIEQNEKQAILLEQSKPAVKFVNDYVNSEGYSNFRSVAKLINVKEATFRAWLQANRIQYKVGNDWLPYSNHVTAERMVVKTDTKAGRTFSYTLFTARGVTWVLKKWNDEHRPVNQIV